MNSPLLELFHNLFIHLKVKMVWPNSLYNHKFSPIGLDMISQAVKGYEESFRKEEIIEVKLTLKIKKQQVIMAILTFGNNYQHILSCDEFQDAYIGKIWHIPNDEETFY